MKSFSTLSSLFTSLTQNTNTGNITLGNQMINDAHRYLLQKYFNNETTFAIPTAGGQSLTLTGSLAAAAISATLTSAWTGNSTKIQVTFSSGDIRMVTFINNSTALTWDVPLSATATTAITVGAQQFYPLPPNYSKLKSITITLGNLQWTLDEVLTTLEWNKLNVFPYYADIPANFFILPGGDHGAQIGIWPIPSTTGNTITFTYKYRVPDLSIADYTTGNVSLTTKTMAVTGGGGATFPVTTNPQLEARWLQIPQTTGDGLWYQVVSVPTSSTMTLYQPYQGTTVSNGTYTLGQMPLLNEDFHDLLVYRPLMIYFSSLNKDIEKAKQFRELYQEGEERLAEYSGSNTIDVNLGRRPYRSNPNLYGQSFGQ